MGEGRIGAHFTLPWAKAGATPLRTSLQNLSPVPAVTSEAVGGLAVPCTDTLHHYKALNIICLRLLEGGPCLLEDSLTALSAAAAQAKAPLDVCIHVAISGLCKAKRGGAKIACLIYHAVERGLVDAVRVYLAIQRLSDHPRL